MAEKELDFILESVTCRKLLKCRNAAYEVTCLAFYSAYLCFIKIITFA